MLENQSTTGRSAMGLQKPLDLWATLGKVPAIPPHMMGV